MLWMYHTIVIVSIHVGREWQHFSAVMFETYSSSQQNYANFLFFPCCTFKFLLTLMFTIFSKVPVPFIHCIHTYIFVLWLQLGYTDKYIFLKPNQKNCVQCNDGTATFEVNIVLHFTYWIN